MSKHDELIKRLVKTELNSVYGTKPRLHCRKCNGSFNGNFYQVRLPLYPVCYGSDENPDITLMYPCMQYAAFHVCEKCYLSILSFLNGEQHE